MDAADRILEWAKEGAELSPPGWEQLPTIPLYVDQVLLYLRDSLRFFERDGEDVLLTNSMINNYVKNGVLPHPEKKKYSRQHLAARILPPCWTGRSWTRSCTPPFCRPTPGLCGRPAGTWKRAAALARTCGGKPCACWQSRF